MKEPNKINNMEVTENNKHSKSVTNDIIKYVIEFHTSIHPFISNAMFSRDKDVLERERFKTLITLSRTLDDENLEKVIIALNYQLTLKDK